MSNVVEVWPIHRFRESAKSAGLLGFELEVETYCLRQYHSFTHSQFFHIGK